MIAEPRTLLTGLGIGESPRWHDGRLWVANWIVGEIVAVAPDGSADVVGAAPTPIPFCFDWLADGSHLVVSGPEGRVLRRGEDGSYDTYADLSALSLHPWNEIVVDPRGNAYVNGIGYDMVGGADPGLGLIAVVSPDGDARVVAEDLAFPNGMAITPDGSTLIVAESHGQRLTAFHVEADGGLANRRVWAELGDGAPDGICLDAEGAVWYADVPNQRCVRVRAGGDVLQTVSVDRGCFACMLGDADRRTLYIVAAEWGDPASLWTARTGVVLSVPVTVPGVGRP